jgi:hypothetical protein
MKMDTDAIRADAVSAVEALSLYARGAQLICPACRTRLEPIPLDTAPGERPQGLKCPQNDRHYLVYGESAETINAAREGLRRISSKAGR